MHTNSTADPVMDDIMKGSAVSSDLIWSGEERKNNTSGENSDSIITSSLSKRENLKQSKADKSLRWTNFDHRVQAMKQGLHKRNGTQEANSLRDKPYIISCSNDGSSDDDNDNHQAGSQLVPGEMRFSLPPMPHKYSKNESVAQSSSLASRQMDWTKSSMEPSQTSRESSTYNIY